MKIARISRTHRLLVAVAVALTAPLGAVAGTYIEPGVYPGSSCKLYAPQSEDTFFTTSGGNNTGLRNADTEVQIISCPAIRTIPGQNYVRSGKIDVSGLTWTTTDCDLSSTSYDGQTKTVAPTAALTSDPTKVTSRYTWGTWTVQPYASVAFSCYAQPREWIFRYELSESNTY
jgi:hypothetical protein